MKKLIFIFVTLAMVPIARAQSILRPGDRTIRTAWVKPSHEFYKNVITDTSGRILYEFMMENVITIDSVRKQIVFARSRQVPAGNYAVDTSITDLSLRPVRMHEIQFQRKRTFEMTFETDKVIAKVSRNGINTLKNYSMPSGYFEDNMIEYIFGFLQLEKGKTYTLNNFNEAQAGSDPFTVMYEFDDIWNFPGDTKINCTVYHFTHGDTTGYVWVDQRTHHILKELGHSRSVTFVLTKQ